jgi:signal peptidase I
MTQAIGGRSTTPSRRALSAATELIVIMVIATLLSLVIKTWLVQAFFIPSPSMEHTLEVGDRVLVSKLTPGVFDLHRGDVVVFKDPGGWLPPPEPADDSAIGGAIRSALTWIGLLPEDSGEHLIKRVIGLPGDTVTCCDAQHRIQVNGVPIDEPYLFSGDQPSTSTFTVTVQPGKLWVMGDHRSDSADSREHRYLDDGQVPITRVVGKAFSVVWPLDRFGGVTEPDQVFARVPDPKK